MEEIWKTHPKISEAYEFSNLGRFKNVKTQQILKPTFDKHSRGCVSFLMDNNGKRKRVRLARLIAELFIPNSDSSLNIVIHKDENVLNNASENLKWGTTKETVDLAFKNKKRISAWQVLSDETVVLIRKEFDETDITSVELAKKYDTSLPNINSILFYKSRYHTTPEKPYKINQLTGSELITFINIKKAKAKQIKRHQAKLKELKELMIDETILSKIASEYINSVDTFKQLSIKYDVSLKALKYQFKDYKFPQVSLQQNEEFKTIDNGVQISNHGRVIVNDKIANTRRFLFNGEPTGIRNIVGKLFVPNIDPNKNTLLNCIDGNLWNVNVNNLEWIFPNKPQYIDKSCLALINGVFRPLDEVKDVIIKDYLESTEYIDFRKKYLIGYTPLYQIIRPYMKQKRDGKCFCENCGETNVRYFYKSRNNACKLCICDDKVEKNKLIENKKNRTIGLVKYPHRVNKEVKNKLTDAKHRAKIKNWHYDLDEEFIKELYKKQDGKCAYSGEPLSLEERCEDKEPFSIDRIDSSKGYTKDNITLITGYINRMKLNWKYDDFLLVIKNIYEYNSLQNLPKKNFFKKGRPLK